MIEWIVAGLIGSYVYGQYSNAKSKQNSFETNSTKKYSQYGTLTLTRRKKK